MRKTSKAEAGRLGGIKSKQTSAIKKQERIDQYMKDPKNCKQCNSILDYNNRRKIFCNNSCAATFNNLQRESRTVPVSWKCINCDKEHSAVKWRIGKYCNYTCQKEYEYKQRIVEWKQTGKIGKGPAKRYLAEQQEGCYTCGITEWNGMPITLELEHIDGNSSNNTEANLSLVCPNCHSQTSTYKNRNKGNGRHARRERYAQGLSY